MCQDYFYKIYIKIGLVKINQNIVVDMVVVNLVIILITQRLVWKMEMDNVDR